MMHSYLQKSRITTIGREVLILVVMDDALVLLETSGLSEQKVQVLILVVMDDALVLGEVCLLGVHFMECLNPCCNG